MYVGNSAIVSKGETRFHSITDLNRDGITIAVTEGEAGCEYAKSHLAKAKLIVLSGGDQSLAFSQVITSRADVALGDAYATAQFALHHSEAINLFAENPYNLTPVSWALRPNDYEWLQFIDTAIETLDIQGKLRNYERQFDAHWLHIQRQWVSW
jgi:polar amino acid transport system substrate-binding protein